MDHTFFRFSSFFSRWILAEKDPDNNNQELSPFTSPLSLPLASLS